MNLYLDGLAIEFDPWIDEYTIGSLWINLQPSTNCLLLLCWFQIVENIVELVHGGGLILVISFGVNPKNDPQTLNKFSLWSRTLESLKTDLNLSSCGKISPFQWLSGQD